MKRERDCMFAASCDTENSIYEFSRLGQDGEQPSSFSLYT